MRGSSFEELQNLQGANSFSWSTSANLIERYQNKSLCVSDLKELGLITSVDAEEIRIDGFDLRDVSLYLKLIQRRSSSKHKASRSKYNSETFRPNKLGGATQFEVRRG